MNNPWTMKNPLLSMWLSGANAIMGSAQSKAAVEAQRQTTLMMARTAAEMGRFWMEAMWWGPLPRKRKSQKDRH